MKLYTFGTPFETIAVDPNSTEEVREEKVLPYLEISRDVVDETPSLVFTRKLAGRDVVYGLGETMRGINKRGGRYVSYNTDCPHHYQSMPSMYGAHNFIVIDGEEKFGVFFDTPSRVTFEIDYENSGELKVICETEDLRLYLIEESSALEISRAFLRLIGPSFLPPLWAFGLGQSRWGYGGDEDVERVFKGYRENELPLDYICLDIDYMDRYIDFTTNTEKLPDLGALSARMKEQGIRLVPIIDAGIKVEPGNKTYDEGLEGGYFSVKENGEPFHAAVWPGMTHFPDFFQPEAREWFGRQYEGLTSQGIEGFWNDMNEPSIFYSEFEGQKSQWLGDIVINKLFPDRQEKGEVSAYRDYKRFYHKINGQLVQHHRVHNLYGALMTVASAGGLEKQVDGRYLLFSRASYIGAHRYGGIWTGDNSSTYEMLRQNLLMMPSLSMCGFIYTGADTGGFGENCNRQLLLRWLALSAFTPLERNHSALHTREQECYAFGDTTAFRALIRLRYLLIPYLYSEFMKANLRRDMLLRPIAFDFPNDERALRTEDQVMVGESVMIAPVLRENSLTRRVYLPEDMQKVRYHLTESGEPVFDVELWKRGEHTVNVPLDEVVFFIKKDAAIIVSTDEKAMSTNEMDLSHVRLLGEGASYEQYLDDGRTKVMAEENIRTVTEAGATA